MKKVLLAGLLLGSLVGGAALLAPALAILSHEKTLAKELEQMVKDEKFSHMPDSELRRKLQSLAREQGFHLALDHILIERNAEKTASSTLRRIGYTLPLELPIGGVFSYSAVLVRVADGTHP